MAKKNNEYKLKRPRRADYIEKYGFEGDRIWRLELLKYEEAKNSRDKYEASLKAQAKRAREETKADKPVTQHSQKLRSTNVAKAQSQTAAPKSATAYTVKAGRSTRTFATKAEAQAYAKQCRNRNVSITQSTRKPTHRVVSFTAKK